MHDSQDPRPTELSPLLPPISTAESRRKRFRYHFKSRVTISSLLVFSAFCFAIIDAFCSSPIDTLFEDALCSRYYSDRGVPKADCHLDQIHESMEWYARALSAVRMVTCKYQRYHSVFGGY